MLTEAQRRAGHEVVHVRPIAAVGGEGERREQRGMVAGVVARAVQAGASALSTRRTALVSSRLLTPATGRTNSSPGAEDPRPRRRG